MSSTFPAQGLQRGGVAEDVMRFHEAIVLSLAALAPTAAVAAPVQLPGQVTYRERIALPDDATLEIQLVDASLPSAPPRLDVRAAIGSGQVPLSFNLTFEDSIIIPDHAYALIAAISNPSGLLFRNFEPYALDPLSPAEPVMIVTNLVGEARTAVSSSSAEAPAAPPPAILDVTWLPASIDGKPIAPRSNPSLAIGSDMRAGGSAGCNSWFAEAKLDGDSVKFGTITSTLKGCTQSINLQEEAFKAALKAAAMWRVENDELTLYDATGKTLIVFRH
jgi:putative lipoprotein